MKYVLLFVGSQEDQARYEGLSQEQREAGMAGAMGWFERYGREGKIVGGEQLQGPRTVTTVRSQDGKRVVTDGPYIESKEVIGGFAIVDVADRAEATEMARSWPVGPVEVWPVVEDMTR